MTHTAMIPAEFVRQYEQERARVLHRRALWYCFIVLALLAMSIGMTLIDLFDPVPDDTPRDNVVTLISDHAYVVLHIAAAVVLLRGPVERRRVVAIISWLIGLTGVAAILTTSLVDNSIVFAGATREPTDSAVRAQGYMTLYTVFILLTIASMLVNLSPRECLRPLVPMLLVFIAWTLLKPGADFGTRLTLIALAPLAGLPGVLFSWWRHRSFCDRFHARAIAQRYQEVTRDLAEARRVHEALFPPPITRGRVRMTYRYEPAQHIGGDFLYARPLSFPPTAPDGSLTIVVLDVTGHGVPAALAVNRLHVELERLLGRGHDASPGEVIEALNDFAAASLTSQRIYGTALCLRITPRTPSATIPPDTGGSHSAAVEWASAGHPDACIRRADDRIERLASTTCMLGVLEGDAFAANPAQTVLHDRDVLIAITDGVTDAFDERGERLGREGGIALVGDLDPARPACDQIMTRLLNWREGAPADDTLIVEVRLAPQHAVTAGGAAALPADPATPPAVTGA